MEWNVRNQAPAAPEVARGFLESAPQPVVEEMKHENTQSPNGRRKYYDPKPIIPDLRISRRLVSEAPAEAARDASIEVDDEMSEHENYDASINFCRHDRAVR